MRFLLCLAVLVPKGDQSAAKALVAWKYCSWPAIYRGISHCILERLSLWSRLWFWGTWPYGRREENSWPLDVAVSFDAPLSRISSVNIYFLDRRTTHPCRASVAHLLLCSRLHGRCRHHGFAFHCPVIFFRLYIVPKNVIGNSHACPPHRASSGGRTSRGVHAAHGVCACLVAKQYTFDFVDHGKSEPAKAPAS